MDDKSNSRSSERREIRRPALDRKWSAAVEAKVLDVIARTGSPKMASEACGISAATIHDHRRRDAEFGARYTQAMDSAFHQVLGRAFERSLDEEPSDRLIEVLLKFRWPERLNGFLALSTEGGSAATAPADLDPRVIARMEPSDRMALVVLLEKYLDAERQPDAQTVLVQG